MENRSGAILKVGTGKTAKLTGEALESSLQASGQGRGRPTSKRVLGSS